ncbi:MAG: S-layer homology domain-containing protein [Candidatus Altimarinota bacterium]
MSKTKKIITAATGLAVGILTVLAANTSGIISKTGSDALTSIFGGQEVDEPGGKVAVKPEATRVFWDYSGGGFQIIEENSFESPTVEKFDHSVFKNLGTGDLVGRAANELAKRGAVEVKEDNYFDGKSQVSRAEAVKTILLTKSKRWEDVDNKGKFADVEDDQWYTKYVMNSAFLGMISADGNKNLRPMANLSTAEFLKMLVVGLDLPQELSFTYEDVSQNDWFAAYAGAAQKYEMFPARRMKLEPGRLVTREEMVVAIYQFLLNRKF